MNYSCQPLLWTLFSPIFYILKKHLMVPSANSLQFSHAFLTTSLERNLELVILAVQTLENISCQTNPHIGWQILFGPSSRLHSPSRPGLQPASTDRQHVPAQRKRNTGREKQRQLREQNILKEQHFKKRNDGERTSNKVAAASPHAYCAVLH